MQVNTPEPHGVSDAPQNALVLHCEGQVQRVDEILELADRYEIIRVERVVDVLKGVVEGDLTGLENLRHLIDQLLLALQPLWVGLPQRLFFPGFLGRHLLAQLHDGAGLQKLLLLLLLARDLLLRHVLDSFGQRFDEVLELNEVGAEVNTTALTLGLLGLSAAATHAEHGEQINVILAELRELAADDLLELLAGDDLTRMLLLLAAKAHMDLSLELLDAVLAGIKQICTTLKLARRNDPAEDLELRRDKLSMNN